MHLKRDMRAAAIGGLAATFVVAVAFLPRLVGEGDSGTVRFEVASTDDPTATSVPDSTTTTSSESVSTTSQATATTMTTTTTKPGTNSTTTTVPAPRMCATIPSVLSGRVVSRWEASASKAETWDRRTTVTVDNPTDMAVTLGWVYLGSATSYDFQIHAADGRRLGPGESVTLEHVLSAYPVAPTDRTYFKHTAMTLPDKLSEVEFRPDANPTLFCKVSRFRPGETVGAAVRGTTSSGYVYADYPSPRDPATPIMVSFSTGPWFDGTVDVEYRMRMADGSLKTFSTDLTEGLVGNTLEADIRFPASDLPTYNTAVPSSNPPWFQGVTTVTWDGATKPCSESVFARWCAPTDGSLLQSFG